MDWTETTAGRDKIFFKKWGGGGGGAWFIDEADIQYINSQI